MMVTINASYITAFAVMLTALEVNFFFKCSEIASSQRASQAALVVKNLPANAGDVRGTVSTLGSGRSPAG